MNGRVTGAEVRRVLVVDDHEDAADTLALLLRIAGHQVRLAYSGASALQVVTNFYPDVILLDLVMPGMDGFATVRQLRSRPESGSAFIVALTGYGLPADRARCTAAGFNLHLLKPVNADYIQKLVQGSRKSAAALYAAG